MSTRRPQDIVLLEQVLKQKIVSFEKIDEGQDGEKYVVKVDQKGSFFCRIKKTREGQKMPYQEAAVLAAVTSPHVTKPTNATIIGGNYIIVRPYIEGDSLAQRLTRGPLSEAETYTLAYALIAAVESLEDVGAVHFDIKPDNIVCGADGAFYLIDFGAAHFLKSVKDERIHPARKYIAPEVLEYLFNPTDLGVSRLSTLTDMYGVGAVLYTAMTGRPLSDFFKGASAVIQQVPPPVKQLVPGANPRLAELAERLLSKNPSRRMRPRDAKAFLDGTDVARLRLPQLFLETKGGKGSEHTSMLPAIIESSNRCGLYWKSGTAPLLPKKMLVPNLLWEPPVPQTEEDLYNSLLSQQQRGVAAFCVPTATLSSPVATMVLTANVELLKKCVEWRNANASPLPVLGVISIDAATLVSPHFEAIKDAYAATPVEGFILHVRVSAYGAHLNVDHLEALKKLIQPLARNGRTVLVDGDLCTLVLTRYGVTGYVFTTFPRLDNEPVATAPGTKKGGQKPDGFYVRDLLGKISFDHAVSLRSGNPVGRALTNCNCPYCSATLMKRNWHSIWDRPARRGHFICVMPREISRIKGYSKQEMIDVVISARRHIARFGSVIPISIPHLEPWLELVSRE